jgi:Golgi apparatus protein 1
MIVQTLKHLAQVFICFVVLVLTPLATASAQESVAEMVLRGCKKELVSYCSTVTPGRGRIAACLFAHNDKLSEQCEGMLEVGMVQLSLILSTVSYVVEQCYRDIDKHCEGVVIGGGRLHRCLAQNRDKLEKNCEAVFTQAEKDLK